MAEVVLPTTRGNKGGERKPIQVGGLSTVHIISQNSALTVTGVLDSNVVRYISNLASHVDIGSAASASSSSTYVAANVAEYFKVVDGSDKLSCMGASGSGGGICTVTLIK